ncbi:MAG TPA: hypothetical protein DEF00_01065 [Candidatus Taylorbacteria bacterium]|nr:MAG: hypothetical protein UY03_C0007G0017 [Parcubacteria group bacterium GW2011_GWA2_47_64]KKU96368.1 MAG: hypothetical protein UY29_C0013G0020 [Parcubacteria group bacterium GW2011_GWC2_48_17]HBV00969.1 hypothetical protein [Candidatus Taylorbacteria bacterium]
MKTAAARNEFFPRKFFVTKDLVRFQPDTPLAKERVPTVLKTSSRLTPLGATLHVWAELIHEGGDDPIGHDRLYAHLVLVVRPIFIKNPPCKLLDTECDSPQKLGAWVLTVKKAFLAANGFAFWPGFSDETIESVFAPLFDAVAELHCRFKIEHLSRAILWQKHCSSAVGEMPPALKNRFTLRFS